MTVVRIDSLEDTKLFWFHFWSECFVGSYFLPDLRTRGV